MVKLQNLRSFILGYFVEERHINRDYAEFDSESESGILMLTVMWDVRHFLGKTTLGQIALTPNGFTNQIYSIYHRLRDAVKSKILHYKAQRSTTTTTTTQKPSAVWLLPPTYGRLPKNAFKAGSDMWGNDIYIGRTIGAPPGYVKDLYPGRLAENRACLEAVVRSSLLQLYARCMNKYEVLTGQNFAWKKHRGKLNDVQNLVRGGHTVFRKYSNIFYICRYYMNEFNITNHLLVGYTNDIGLCYLAYNNEIHVYENVFEVLVHN